MKKSLVMVLLLAFGLSGTAALVLEIGKGKASPDLTDGAVGLLGRPAGQQDVLPAKLLSTPAAKFVDSGGARLSQVDGGEALFAAPSTDGGICLVVALDQDDTPMSCGTRDLLKQSALYISVPSGTGTGVDVYGLVGDGVSTAGAVNVFNNTFVIRGLTSPSVPIAGSAGEATLDLSASLTP